MKISYRTAGSGSYTSVLADLASSPPELISGYAPSMQSEAQLEALFGGTHKVIFDRANTAWSLSFTVSREHTTGAVATAFIASHALDLAGLKDLKIEEGLTTLYLVRAKLTRFQPTEETNKSTSVSYQFVGEQYTSTAP